MNVYMNVYNLAKCLSLKGVFAKNERGYVTNLDANTLTITLLKV